MPISNEDRYFGQLRIPTRDEFEYLKSLASKNPLQKAQNKMCYWMRDFIPQTILRRYFKFDPMADMENRFDWEVLYNILKQKGEGKGWIKDGELTPFDYEQEIKDKFKRVYKPTY